MPSSNSAKSTNSMQTLATPSRCGVFIPAYNASNYISAAIKSVLDQSFKDFHLFVLDDASTDDTHEVVKPWLMDSRVTYIRHPRNLGMSRNWNEGLRLTENFEFVAKLDADDFYEPAFLQNVIRVFGRDSQIGLVFTGVHWVSVKE